MLRRGRRTRRPGPFRRAISASASASLALSFLRTLATWAVVSSSAIAADDSYSSTYSSAQGVDPLHRGVVVGRLDQGIHGFPRTVGQVDQTGRDLEAIPVGAGAVEVGVDEVVDRVVAAGVVEPQAQLGSGPGHRSAPVADQVVVRHERARVAPRGPLGLEGRVDPCRDVGRLALAAEVAVHVAEVRRVA